MLRARDLVTLSNHRAGRCCTASAEMTKSYTKRRRKSAEAKKVNDNIVPALIATSEYDTSWLNAEGNGSPVVSNVNRLFDGVLRRFLTECGLRARGTAGLCQPLECGLRATGAAEPVPDRVDLDCVHLDLSSDFATGKMLSKEKVLENYKKSACGKYLQGSRPDIKYVKAERAKDCKRFEQIKSNQEYAVDMDCETRSLLDESAQFYKMNIDNIREGQVLSMKQQADIFFFRKCCRWSAVSAAPGAKEAAAGAAAGTFLLRRRTWKKACGVVRDLEKSLRSGPGP